MLDGELLIWNGDRLDFDLLQQRLVNSTKKAAFWRRDAPPPTWPSTCYAHVAMDLRAIPGHAPCNLGASQ